MLLLKCSKVYHILLKFAIFYGEFLKEYLISVIGLLFDVNEVVEQGGSFCKICPGSGRGIECKSGRCVMVDLIGFFRVKCGEYCISEVVTRLWVNFTLGPNFTAKEQRYRQISAVFLAPQLLTIDIKNVNSSDSLRAQKGTQKHNEYLPKSGR